jgi:NitT/TauT family transport system substrate-binding protein
MTSTWKRWGTAAILLVLLGCVGVAVYYSSFTIQPPLQKVTIARTGGIPMAFFWIAQDNGYFKDAGLDVSYLDFDQGPPALAELKAMHADITASGELPIVRSILTGDNIRILAELESDFGKNIIGRVDRGIQKPQDLRGKRIGVTKGTVNEFQLSSLLEASGVPESTVTIVDVPFANAKDALTSGEVDAVSARQATVVQLQKYLGENGVVFSTEGIYTFRFLVVANESFTVAHPDTTAKVIASLVKAERFAKEHPEEARAVVARNLHVSQDVVDAAWVQYHFNINLSQPIFVTLEDEARWLMGRDPMLPHTMPNFLSYLYFDALAAAKPDSISITH